MDTIVASVLVVCLIVCGVNADYTCVCSFNGVHPVYNNSDVTSYVIGYLAVNQCRMSMFAFGGQWNVIMFDHQVGYIVKTDNSMLQKCTGTPSIYDILTTARPNSFQTTESTVSTKRTTHIFTQKPTTSHTMSTNLSTIMQSSRDVPTSNIQIIQNATLQTQKSNTTDTPSTTFPPSTFVFMSMTNATKLTTPMTTYSSPSTKTSITTSAASVSTHSTVESSTIPFTTLDLPSIIEGNTHLCSTTVQHDASQQGGVLGQYDNSCYAFLPTQKVAWNHGESICKQSGGHLAHINNAQEQAFIQRFLMAHSPDHVVWIGLNDIDMEGQLQWTSGSTVQYTNWVAGHTSNFVSHHQEDCVAFIPYHDGQWDDIPCGSQGLFGGDSGEIHPILCQYEIITRVVPIGK